jgi:hypothetical protein
MADHYSEQVGQRLPDPQWIREMSAAGLVLLSKDHAVRHDHRDVIVSCEAKVFLLPDQSSAAADQAARIVFHRHRIALKAQRRGPMIYILRPKTIDREL